MACILSSSMNWMRSVSNVGQQTMEQALVIVSLISFYLRCVFRFEYTRLSIDSNVHIDGWR